MAGVSVENCYVALLSIAEGFRTSQPPDLPTALQCLMAVLNLPINHREMAHTHLKIGNLILDNSTSIDLAKSHIEKAWQIAQPLPDAEDIKLEAASQLAVILTRQNQSHTAKGILSKAIEEAARNVFWRCKLLFQLAQLHVTDREYQLAAQILSNGADYAAHANCQNTRILFIISKGMTLMIDRRLTEVHPILSTAGQLVESWKGPPQQQERLKVFFLVLQVCHYLNTGQVKSVKGPLKLLQQSIQNITTFQGEEPRPMNPGDNFEWLQKDHLCILVYLVTVLHSMQAGYMDKAQKYTEKALMHIESRKQQEDHPLLHTFQLLLLEHIVMCRIVMGNKTLAIKEIAQALTICWRDHKLQVRHKPIVHCLLGMYSMSMNCMNESEQQLSAVLRSPNASNELKILASLNLAIVYLKMNRPMELNDLLLKLNPDHLPSISQSLKAASYYVLGLNAFFQARYNDAKRNLRETLTMANSEDLNRLTSCSLVLLGHIFYSLSNPRETMNMVTPAMQLASKIPDIHVQLWASALLKDLYRIHGDHAREQETIQMHNNFSQYIYREECQAVQLPEHGYIRWLGDEQVT